VYVYWVVEVLARIDEEIEREHIPGLSRSSLALIRKILKKCLLVLRSICDKKMI